MMTDRNPSWHFGQLRRSVQRYREGKIDAERLAANVERFLEWDASRNQPKPQQMADDELDAIRFGNFSPG